MAFLDNSGDIILDAVLTDVGRKRMAAGNFKITKFALGDDEIDYGLYNKDHPSGSAYYDLEILQTPILEAFTQINASINYGLLTYARADLLYLPDIKLNAKTPTGADTVSAPAGSTGVLYLCDDASAAGVTSTVLDGESSIETKQLMIDQNPLTRFLLFETGLDTADLEPTSGNQATYLTSVGLLDESFTVNFDYRIIQNIQYGAAGTFESRGTGSPINLEVNAFTKASTVALSRDMSAYAGVAIPAFTSRLFSGGSLPSAATVNAASAIAGPKGAWQGIVPVIQASLPDATYQQLGKTNQNIGLGNLYNWIDTVIYIQGQSTNIILQVPIRIIKLVSAV